MVISIKQNIKTTAVAALLLVGLVACGEDGHSQVSIELFGWVDDGTDDGQFIQGLPEFDGADELRLRVTHPDGGEVLSERTVSIDEGSASVPDIAGGPGRRMEFEIRADGQSLATGATPTFNVNQEGLYRGFRTMVSEVDHFAPVGSIVHGSESGQPELMDSTFDVRQLDDIDWSGRLGHSVEVTSSGEVLIVGGAQLSDSYQPLTVPPINKVFSDIQIFDPATGYFTELGGDDDARRARVVGEDRLDQPRAFHTVTSVGDDRFIVAGGFSEGGAPVDSVELIDLGADPGQRITTLDGGLDTARGFHTATFRDSDDSVVVAGGLGAGDDDVIDTIEIIDPDSGVESGPSMNSARVGHSAVLLEDDQTIWFIGGRGSGSDVWSSTETLEAGDETVAGPSLDQARYGAAAVHLGQDANDSVVVVGGFTAGGATASYEIGNPLNRDQMQSGNGWSIDRARGGLALVALEQSGDLVAIGGYDGDRQALSSAERLNISLAELPPLSVDTELGQMHRLRSQPGVSAISSGRIFVVGGQGAQQFARNDAEYFNPYDPIAP